MVRTRGQEKVAGIHESKVPAPSQSAPNPTKRQKSGGTRRLPVVNDATTQDRPSTDDHKTLSREAQNELEELQHTTRQFRCLSDVLADSLSPASLSLFILGEFTQDIVDDVIFDVIREQKRGVSAQSPAERQVITTSQHHQSSDHEEWGEEVSVGHHRVEVFGNYEDDVTSNRGPSGSNSRDANHLNSSSAVTFMCDNCKRLVNAARYAPHLEKCMFTQRGRSSARLRSSTLRNTSTSTTSSLRASKASSSSSRLVSRGSSHDDVTFMSDESGNESKDSTQTEPRRKRTRITRRPRMKRVPESNAKNTTSSTSASSRQNNQKKKGTLAAKPQAQLTIRQTTIPPVSSSSSSRISEDADESATSSSDEEQVEVDDDDDEESASASNQQLYRVPRSTLIISTEEDFSSAKSDDDIDSLNEFEDAHERNLGTSQFLHPPL